jgi:hypothetical protein
VKFQHVLPLLVLAAGCPEKLDVGTGDTGTGGECGADRYDGPIEIQGAEVTCTGTTVRFAAETKGLTGDGIVFSQETASTYAGGQWSDNHTIETYEFDVCGTYDRLERTIDDGTTLDDPLNDWQTDQSSVFRCGDHYTDNDFMTFAFGVNDQSGNLADCFAFGHDPTGLASGDYNGDRIGDDPLFSLSGCRAGEEGI